jgi:demethylmenaquinone methyltransferase/2-methoxy-6-polyprenyl-1,4-benzoquinol methylase
VNTTIPAKGSPLPSGDDKTAAVRQMFDAIAGRYDLVNRLMTFGMDQGWRSRAIDSLSVTRGATVLDLACGTGDMARELQARGVTAIGADLSFGMLAAAPHPFARLQCDSVALALADGSVEGITCGFALRNFTDLTATLSELARVLSPGGRIALLDVAEPPNALMRLGHSVYFNRVVPVVGGLLSDRDAYAYLPRSVAYLPPTDELLALVHAAGFGQITRTLLTGGIAQLISAERNPG